MAACSHAYSSTGGFPATALATKFPWHWRIARCNLPIFLAAFASHFAASLSEVKNPPSSPPGHTMAPAVEQQIVMPSATPNTVLNTHVRCPPRSWRIRSTTLGAFNRFCLAILSSLCGREPIPPRMEGRPARALQRRDNASQLGNPRSRQGRKRSVVRQATNGQAQRRSRVAAAPTRPGALRAVCAVLAEVAMTVQRRDSAPTPRDAGALSQMLRVATERSRGVADGTHVQASDLTVRVHAA